MSSTRKYSGLLIFFAALLVLSVASLAIGSNPIAPTTAWDVLLHPNNSFESTIIHEQRIPRTILVIVVGVALGVAGALMQSLTRNPLADPGILGVNAGASIAVVGAVAVFGLTSIWFYLWFAFAGAAAASALVYVLGGLGRKHSQSGMGGATPARLALAGVAISMVISSFVQLIILNDRNVFNEFRYWAAGSVENRGYPIILGVVGFIIAGLLIAFVTAPGLNAMALGEEAGKALGVRVNTLRAGVMIAVTLLAGAATAAVGPIMFIGLGVPFIARFFTGPDQRWVIPFCALVAPTVMLFADIVARVVVMPQEIQTGIITAILGGPVFIFLVRRSKIEVA